MSAQSDTLDEAWRALDEAYAEAYGTFRVLVVDDNPDCRTLMRAVMKRLGAEVVEAPDATTALTVLESGRVGMVITDIHMPGKNGIELAIQLRREHPHLPVVLATQFDIALRAAQNYDELCDIHAIRKPLTIPTMRAILMQLGKPWHEQQDREPQHSG